MLPFIDIRTVEVIRDSYLDQLDDRLRSIDSHIGASEVAVARYILNSFTNVLSTAAIAQATITARN